MKDRLAQFLRSEGLTAVKFAEIMEVQPSSISHLLSGRNKPNFEFISRLLLRFPALNPNWIINGVGDVYKCKDNADELNITNINRREITDVNKGNLTDVNNDFSKIQQGDIFDNKSDEHSTSNTSKEVTDVTNIEMESAISLVPDVDRDTRKSISRIIIFYTDGSFDEYRN